MHSMFNLLCPMFMVGKIMTHEDVHILMPEPVNMLPLHAEGTLQI